MQNYRPIAKKHWYYSSHSVTVESSGRIAYIVMVGSNSGPGYAHEMHGEQTLDEFLRDGPPKAAELTGQAELAELRSYILEHACAGEPTAARFAFDVPQGVSVSVWDRPQQLCIDGVPITQPVAPQRPPPEFIDDLRPGYENYRKAGALFHVLVQPGQHRLHGRVKLNPKRSDAIDSAGTLDVVAVVDLPFEVPAGQTQDFVVEFTIVDADAGRAVLHRWS